MFQSKEEYLFIVVTISVAIFVIIAFLLLVLFNNYRIRVIKNAEILRSVINAEEQERNRIASDMHDELVPIVSALKLELESVIELIEEEKSKSELLLIASQLNSLSQNIRTMARSLSSITVEKFGLTKALSDYMKIIERKGEVRFDFRSDNMPELSLFAQSNIYRILQELISNSLRHSNCSLINLNFKQNKHRHLIIIYADNGRPVGSTDIDTGIGLNNIISRVKMLNGTCVLPQSFNEATHYIFDFPLSSLEI